MRQVLAIVGATGTGKSALADALALRLNGEIVSADSMQVYRGMDIGTAKMPLEQRSVPYHCLDLVDPGTEFNAALYQYFARTAIEDILAREKLPVVCGGTGLYIRTALDCFELSSSNEAKDSLAGSLPGSSPGSPLGSPTKSLPESPPAPTLRQRLNTEAEQLGPEQFHAKLLAVDPDSAALIHPNNVRRVVRAFEFLAAGSSYARQSSGFSDYQELYPTSYFGISWETAALYQRINQRVDSMLASGLLDEVRRLEAAGFSEAMNAAQAIGYKELLPVLSKQTSLEAASEQIKQATRHYAKRQKTWFKRDTRIKWLDGNSKLDALVDDIEQLVAQGKRTAPAQKSLSSRA